MNFTNLKMRPSKICKEGKPFQIIKCNFPVWFILFLTEVFTNAEEEMEIFVESETYAPKQA